MSVIKWLFFFNGNVNNSQPSSRRLGYHRVKVFYNNRDRITRHVQEEEDAFVSARRDSRDSSYLSEHVISPSCNDASLNKPPDFRPELTPSFSLKKNCYLHISHELTTLKPRVSFNFFMNFR